MMDVLALRKELDVQRPLIFFHDDPDGLCSFLLFYRYIKEGKGVVIKSHPKVDEKFIRKVEEYQPDKVFVLDIAMMSQGFVDRVKQPIVWIDHHEPQDIKGVVYYNPLKERKNKPASQVCYEIVDQDLWIAMVGITSDWYFKPRLAAKFRKKYPDLLPKEVKTPQEALFGTPLGKLARIFWFALKGNSGDAMKYVKVLTRINSPYEIMNQETPQGTYIYKKYKRINKDYQALLKDAESKVSDNKLLVFIYPGRNMSFTGELSNELLYLHPDKVIVVGRDKSGEVKFSVRSAGNVRDPIKKALEGIRGRGGGHKNACGVVVDSDDYLKFLENLRKEV